MVHILSQESPTDQWDMTMGDVKKVAFSTLPSVGTWASSRPCTASRPGTGSAQVEPPAVLEPAAVLEQLANIMPVELLVIAPQSSPTSQEIAGGLVSGALEQATLDSKQESSDVDEASKSSKQRPTPSEIGFIEGATSVKAYEPSSPAVSTTSKSQVGSGLAATMVTRAVGEVEELGDPREMASVISSVRSMVGPSTVGGQEAASSVSALAIQEASFVTLSALQEARPTSGASRVSTGCGFPETPVAKIEEKSPDLFDQIDVNKDGLVSNQELDAAVRAGLLVEASLRDSSADRGELIQSVLEDAEACQSTSEVQVDRMSEVADIPEQERNIQASPSSAYPSRTAVHSPQRVMPGENCRRVRRSITAADLRQANPLQQLHFQTIRELVREFDEAVVAAALASDEESEALETRVDMLELAVQEARAEYVANYDQPIEME